eukprot:TRINITY_DN4201_c0_g1_i7.p2 TRINITY_DN4201_c0_g1~~TRINITY_DN4201_c0_g1_i7.p2  ORF type:complete len:140 (-),score=23.90 TRINITY_DN4201_c0_g1_i7:907-1326(-)
MYEVQCEDIPIVALNISLMEKAPQSVPYENFTLAIIPMGVPGIGKSRVFESLLKLGKALEVFNFDSISSDEVRKECMDKYMLEHPGANKNAAFKNSQGPYKPAFTKALNQAAKNLVPGKAHCIIVDKNHPGNGIAGSIQ